MYIVGILVALVVVVLAKGICIVPQSFNVIVERFGRYKETLTAPTAATTCARNTPQSSTPKS